MGQKRNFVKQNMEQFLPPYLSQTTREGLIEGLEQFPKQLHTRLYSSAHLQDRPNVLFQGDCINSIPIVQWGEPEVKASCILLTNTCDMAMDNNRNDISNIVYAPIIKLKKYQNKLAKNGVQSHRIKDILNSIKNQENTSLFYLPEYTNNGLSYEGVAVLDKLCSVPLTYDVHEMMLHQRECSLGQFGHYLFLFKISMHFTRMGEQIDRENP